MIHWRRTSQIAPGRQADAIARAREYEACWKSHGIEQRTTLVLTGTLGRLCWSWEWESMAAREAGRGKVFADPHMIAIAYRLERSLEWDRAAQAFKGDEQANRLIDRARREPWII